MVIMLLCGLVNVGVFLVGTPFVLGGAQTAAVQQLWFYNYFLRNLFIGGFQR